jgi:hypothetical protein
MAPNWQRPTRPREKVRPSLLDLSRRVRRNEEGRRPPAAPSREAGRSPARSGTGGPGRPHSSPALARRTEPRRLPAPWHGGRSRSRLPTLAGWPWSPLARRPSRGRLPALAGLELLAAGGELRLPAPVPRRAEPRPPAPVPSHAGSNRGGGGRGGREDRDAMGKKGEAREMRCAGVNKAGFF